MDLKNRVYLVTGGSKGFGLSIAKALVARGARVGLLSRNPQDLSQAVTDIGGDYAYGVAADVGSSDQLRRAFAEVVQHFGRLDGLINNAGILDANRDDLSAIDYDEWQEIFAINSMAPVRMSLAFKDNLKLSANPRIVTVSSEMGSLNHNLEGAIAYRSSKAAVNKAMQVLATNFSSDGIIVVPIHPGWVRTEMGGDDADTSTEESAAGLIRRFDALTVETAGCFEFYSGEAIPF